METSILESIGTEIIGVMSPVSVCMLLVVLLVSSLSSPSSTPTSIRTAATLVYLETPSDTTAQKLEGALLNAAVFIVLIAVVTFLLVLLYYYRCTGFLTNYMRFSAFFVFGTMGGPIFLSIIQRFSIPIDVVTCLLLLLNFTLVGVISVFSRGVPILLKQCYMVVLGIITATWFTKLPEWTTWVLLVALAVYDLVAVLAPGGPLKILVELASSRDDELPALVYEARPVVARNADGSRGSLGLLVGGVSSEDSIELQPVMQNIEGGVARNSEYSSVELGNLPPYDESNNVEEDEETSPLVSSPYPRPYVSSVTSEIVEEHIHTPGHETEHMRRRRDTGSRGVDISIPGIKLGLGDFVFYSVLVGRAAMYDLMTVYACYLAIISGLGCTLMLLSVYQRALPALPISIILGVTFYFLTRLLMEPFVVGLSTNLAMF